MLLKSNEPPPSRRRTQRFISRIQDDGGISIFCCCYCLFFFFFCFFYINTPECATCGWGRGMGAVARWVNRKIWSTKIKKSASVRSLKWKFCDGIESKVKKFPADASFVALQHYDHHPAPHTYPHIFMCVCVCIMCMCDEIIFMIISSFRWAHS